VRGDAHATTRTLLVFANSAPPIFPKLR